MQSPARRSERKGKSGFRRSRKAFWQKTSCPSSERVRAAGSTSNAAIAGKLSERRVPTARGGKWTHVQVGAILDRTAAHP
jgi:hypothetical protein